MSNLFKINNEDIKKEIIRIKTSQLAKVLGMLQNVNKETQSLLLTFNKFDILF